jgi:fucose 4-O-acetylase-like acetyltransferase
MCQSNIRNENLHFINVAKTLAIFRVALAHLPIPKEIYSFINSFHMPLFFLITGYLLSTENISFKNFFIKKLRTLLIPYFVFVAISFIFWYFVGRKYGDDVSSGHTPAKYFIGALLAIPSKEYLGFNLPLWFLPSLFCSEILFYWIRRFCVRYSFLLVIFCFGAGILLKEMNLFRLPFGIDVSLHALLFIQTGKWLKEKDLINQYICRRNKITQIIFSVVFLSLTIFISYLNQAHGAILMYECHFNNYLLFIAGAFTGSLFILYLSNYICNSRLFDFYGRNTILILGLHLICFSLIKGIQVFLLQIPIEVTNLSFMVSIIYVIFTFILLAPVIYFVNKYTPFLLGRKKGVF